MNASRTGFPAPAVAALPLPVVPLMALRRFRAKEAGAR